MSEPKLKILVLSYFQGNDANTIRDFLYSFNLHSKHDYYYLHAWNRERCKRMEKLDFNQFDVIVLFWDYYWTHADNELNACYLPDWVYERIASAPALKVMFLQDEYRSVRRINRLMARLGVNVMCSCVAEQDHDLFYPVSLIPSLKATYTILTGYVPAYLEKIDCPVEAPRQVDIGYRSRAVPFWLGNLGQEKTQIATAFSVIGPQSGFSTDISVREEDRLYGMKWLEFLRSSRFSLGTESGASVVDFDGTIREQCDRFVLEHPQATYEDVQHLFAAVDGKVVIQTISPRIFEATAFRQTLVLHEGNYAGILIPDVHFMAVKKDYSNIAEIVERMRDTTFCQQLAEKAHADLIQSGAYSYRSFARRFDEIISQNLESPVRKSAQSRVLFYAENYLHGDTVIPRGGNFAVLPSITDLARQSIESRSVRGLRASLVSGALILTLLANSPRLQRRLIEAILCPQRPSGFSWTGLGRDLRILALLNSSRFRKHPSGPPYCVELEYEADRNRLVFRSVPTSDGDESAQSMSPERMHEEMRILGALEQCDSWASITWDHHEVGDTLALTFKDVVHDVVYIGGDGTHVFRNLHALFAGKELEEVAVVADVLHQDLTKPAGMSTLWTFIQIASALAAFLFVKAPIAAVRSMFDRLQTWARREKQAQSESSIRQP